MGLDMYAYAGRKGQREEYYEKGYWNSDINEFESTVSKPAEIAYWRKHPSLHGWMEQRWIQKGRPGFDFKNYAPDQDPEFNGIELELSWQDIVDLEQVVRHGKLPFTEGFFFGKSADQHYYEEDLKFCADAKAEIFLGQCVFYNSSW